MEKTTFKKRQDLFKTDGWKRFKKNKLALAGTVVILIMVLAAVFCAPVLPWIKARVDAYAVEEKQQAAVVALQAAGCLLLVMVSTAYLVGQSYNPFLYFRF